MGKGLTIGGIVILVIGIFVLIFGTYVQGVQSRNVQECQSFSGELGQFFSPENSDICQRAPSLLMMSLIGIVAGIVMIVIGGVLSAVGAIRKSPSQFAPTTTQPGQVIGSPIHPVEKEESGVRDVKENQSPSTKANILSVADELSKLLALKEKGVLTEEEFARLKKDLLDGKNSNA